MGKAVQLAGQWLAYVSVRLALCVVQTASIETCQFGCRALAWFACEVLRIRRQVVLQNLTRAFPDWTDAQRARVARRMWEHLLLMACELAHMQRKLHETNWTRYLSFERRAQAVRMLLDPRPTVVVSGHFGNFELGCYLIGLLGFRGYAIARPLDNPFLDRFVRKFRESKGQYILDKDGCAQQIADLLEAGETLNLLGDQFAGPKGCWVEFFGQSASCHKGVALFTLTSGAPMSVMAVVRRSERPMEYAVELAGQVDPRSLPADLSHVKGLTRWYNARLEDLIRRYPAQYWWLHRRWKGEPPKRAKGGVAPAPAESADERRAAA